MYAHVTIINSLLTYLLVQPRKTGPCLTERLLLGRKESNQTNKSCATWTVCVWNQTRSHILLEKIIFHLRINSKYETKRRSSVFWNSTLCQISSTYWWGYSPLAVQNNYFFISNWLRAFAVGICDKYQNLMNCLLFCLTHLSRMKFPTFINWTSPFLL